MAEAGAPLYRRMRPQLGTFVEISACGAGAEAAVAAAFASIAEVERALSFQRADSELSLLNANPGRWCTLSPVALRVLRLARAMTRASEEYFNCTVGGELVARGALPDHGGEYLRCGAAADIDLDHYRARLRRPVRVTLDGIAKGYAVDLAVAALKRGKLGYGWVNAGGDLRVFGDCRLPVSRRDPAGALVPLGELREAAMATSQRGDAGELAGLVVDPRGGQWGGAAVFSIISRFAWRADALTKVAAVAPAAQRASLVNRLGGYLVEGEPGDRTHA